MASYVNNRAKAKLMSGDIDLNADDIRIALMMTNTTVDTEDDMEFLSGYTTLDEMDGANYVRKSLANEAVAADLTNNRGEFDADDVVWTALGAGARQIAGFLVYKHVGADSANIPICWVDSGGFPIAANGGDITIQFNAEGILQLT